MDVQGYRGWSYLWDTTGLQLGEHTLEFVMACADGSHHQAGTHLLIVAEEETGDPSTIQTVMDTLGLSVYLLLVILVLVGIVVYRRLGVRPLERPPLPGDGPEPGL